MSRSSTLLGSAMSFAHLLGRAAPDPAGGGAPAAPSAAPASSPAPAGTKAEDDDDKPDDQREDETDEEYRERKRRERDKDKDDDKDDAKKARRAERARCAAIFASPHAGTRPDMAAHLAFATDLSAAEALNTLAAIAAGQPQATAPKNGLRGRMEGQRSPDLGAPDAGSGEPADNSPDAVARRSLAAAGIQVPPGAVRTLPATSQH